MRNTTRLTAAAAATAAGALALSMVLTGSASADPSFTPDADDIVGVGSNTTEFLMQALADKFNADGVGGTMRMASFDAEGSATIVLRQGSDPITRPNGSSAGIDELQANSDVSFARSSRGPNASGDEGTSFYPYAKDKLSYVYAKPNSNVDPNMTASDLFDVYTCGKTDWSDFGQPAGHIQARVPQAGSGTRSFFLASIGETEAQLQAAIAQPDGVCDVGEVEEHDPHAVIGKPNAIAPFSGARYKTLAPKLKRKVTYAANEGAPFNVTRNVYNVIRTADAGSLAKFFDSNSWLCKSDASKRIIKQQGFTKLAASDCGVPIIQ
jgi:ABC-type phosphate transport system substrate-binding protein